mgnify:CR=1 FL=1
MADIRRQVPDASPNTFVRQGVVDNSAATIVGALGEGALNLDATLAKERLAKASDMLNAQYVVGSPAAATQTEDSATDATPLSPEDDRSLNDFQNVLNTNVRARDQGKMNFDSYQLRGERLLRIAIAKRPGLAQEFRQIAAQHLGTDVLGAEVNFLNRQEDAMTKSAANAAAQADKDKWKLYDDQVEQMKANGFAGYIAFQGPDDPGYQQYFQEIFPALSQKVAASSALKMAEQQVAFTNTTKEANRDAQGALWTAKAQDLIATVPGTVENVRALLKQRGLENDPAAVRDTMTTVLNGLNEKIRELEVSASNGTVDPTLAASYMERLNGLRTMTQGVISGASDKDLLGTYNDVLVAAQKASMYSNDEYLRLRTVTQDLPDSVAAQITGKMEKRVTLIVGDMLQDTGNPTEQARFAGATVQQMVKAILPDGSSTAPDPVAVSKMGDVFVRSATAFLTQPDADFRADQFSLNPVSNAAGFLKNLDNQMVALKRTLPDQNKQELASMIAAVANRQTRLLAGRMYTVAPGLKTKVLADYAATDGQLFKLKPGVDEASITAVERAQLRAANQSAQLGLLKRVIGGLTGGSPEAVAPFIKAAYGPSQAAEQAARQRQATPVQAAPSGGPTAPSVGSVVRGYRFKGGDPAQRSSWEKV